MYRQISVEERYTLGDLREAGRSGVQIAQALGRRRNTIWREVRRNRAASDGTYRPNSPSGTRAAADPSPAATGTSSPTSGLKSAGCCCATGAPTRCRPSAAAPAPPHQPRDDLPAHLGRQARGWRLVPPSPRRAGAVSEALRRARPSRAPPGKRCITARPRLVDLRARIGDWEGDTILGADGTRPCVLSFVERKTGYVLFGQVGARTTVAVQRRAMALLTRQPHLLRTLTLDNGTEFHGYAALEAALGRARSSLPTYRARGSGALATAVGRRHRQ